MKAIALVSSNALLDIPDSCMIRSGKPFFIPEFDTEFNAYPALAVRIERLGKCVASRFADRYYTHIHVAVSMRAENILSSLRENGLPWSEAVVFDRSLILSDPVEKGEILGKEPTVTVDCGEVNLTLSTADLENRIAEAIAYVSRNNTIRTGDIIILRLPDSGIPLAGPSHLHASISGQVILSTNIK